jgi:hypothetical protein
LVLVRLVLVGLIVLGVAAFVGRIAQVGEVYGDKRKMLSVRLGMAVVLCEAFVGARNYEAQQVACVRSLAGPAWAAAGGPGGVELVVVLAGHQ